MTRGAPRGVAQIAALLLLLCALGALGAVLASGAPARPGRPAHHARTHARQSGRVCHRKHRHRGRCVPKHKAHSKHSKRPRVVPKPSSRKSAPAGGAGGSTTGGSTGLAAPPTTVVPGSGGPSGTPSPSAPVTARVQVIAQEYSFTLSRSSIPAGPVVIEFVNRGQDAHNLHFDNAAEAGEAGSFPNTESEAHESLHFNLRAGSYRLFCSLQSHEALGMKATLTVQ